MKNKFSWCILLSLLTIILPINTRLINAQNDSEDFCEKFPLNSRCQEKESEIETEPSPSVDSSNSEIIDILTIEEVERYLKEIGYIDITRDNESSLTFYIEGRLCTVFIDPEGTGMALFSYYPKDEKTTLEVINDWNKSLRYSFAYLYTTKKNNEVIVLETNLTVAGGVTKERIKSFFVFHGVYQGYFSRYLSEL